MNSSAACVTVILVHGAWADGSIWSKVILPLTRYDLHVIAAPIPLTSLQDDAAAVRRVIDRTDGPVVLVAQAYAGAVISAADHERVRALVYIAALTPDEGETVAEMFYREAPHPKAPRLAPDANALIWMPEGGFEAAVAHRASPDQTAIMAAIQRPIALACIQEAVPAPAWRTKPSWFLVAEDDRMISPVTQHFMADRMGAQKSRYPVDHSPMVTAPEVVVNVIREAVEAATDTRRPAEQVS
jgi:pimeloyl-ACP methyl ester carboxylesterase